MKDEENRKNDFLLLLNLLITDNVFCVVLFWVYFAFLLNMLTCGYIVKMQHCNFFFVFSYYCLLSIKSMNIFAHVCAHIYVCSIYKISETLDKFWWNQ